MDGYFYTRVNDDYGSSYDQIGDLRIKWEYVEAGNEISVLAK